MKADGWHVKNVGDFILGECCTPCKVTINRRRGQYDALIANALSIEPPLPEPELDRDERIFSTLTCAVVLIIVLAVGVGLDRLAIWAAR